MIPKAEGADCEHCSLATGAMVPSYGPQEAQVAVIGGAPGRDEVKAGQPFVGPPGKLLKEILRQTGINPDEAFYSNAVLCQPPDNRTPTKTEIKCCAPRLKREIDEHKISKILPVGNTANISIFGKSTPITTLRAGPPKSSENYPGIAIIPSLHPSTCLRSGDSFPSLVTDVAKLISTVYIKWEPPTYTVWDDEEPTLRAINELYHYKDRLVVDIETAHDKDIAFTHPNQYELLCIGIGYKPGKVVVLERNALKSARVKAKLGSLLEVSNLTCQNGKFDLQGIQSFAPNCKLHFDTMLSSYTLDERQGVHSLGYISQENLGAPNWKAAMKEWPNYAYAPIDILNRYNAYDVSCTWANEDYYRAKMDKELTSLHDRLVRTSNALVSVELQGLKVDEPYLSDLESEWESKLDALEWGLAPYLPDSDKKGFTKNPRSVPQVTNALHQWITNVPTTDAEFLTKQLEKARKGTDLYEFLKLLLEYRKEQKLYGTYIAGARKRLYEGRLYPTFLLHGTTSGRLSCRNPNLFNIPRGSNIRKMFIPRRGRTFVQCDYSQAEWRVVATLAKDEWLREIFSDPTRDIHSEVAARIGTSRQVAKTVAHATNYGMEAPHLAALINVPIRTAARHIKEFFSTVPNVVARQQSVRERIFNGHEDLVTPYGRHRRFHLITDENKKDVYKEGLSFEPQSISSDICTEAWVELLEAGYDAQLSVYDSVMIECAPEDATEVGQEMQRVMMEAGKRFSDYIPFTVDIKIGKSWGSLE